MPEPARTRRSWVSKTVAVPRQRLSVWAAAVSLAGAIGLCCGAVAVRVGIGVAGRLLQRAVGWPTALTLAVAACFAGALLVAAWYDLRRRRLLRWAARHGWAQVHGRLVWPWTARQIVDGAVTVHYALTGLVDGRSVTAGWASWNRDGLEGATEQASGQGAFAILRLPRSYPAACVHRRRNSAPWPGDGDAEFWNTYRVVVDDLSLADQLAGPEVRRAHIAGEIPTWTIAGDEIYTVHPSRRPLSPAGVYALAGGLLRAAALLKLLDGVERSTP